MIYARDISNAWYCMVRECLDDGYEYLIERGSFAGHHRKQMPYIAVKIAHPESRPLAVEYNGCMLSTDKAIVNYFTQLTTPEKATNEVYTYGERLAPELPKVMNMLKKTPMTNQATIEIGRPEDIELEDPPCLRVVSWKVVDGKLQLSFFFRSWDAVNGVPFNLGGLQLLNEIVAEYTGIPTGPLIAYSDGLHVYDMSYNILDRL